MLSTSFVGYLVTMEALAYIILVSSLSCRQVSDEHLLCSGVITKAIE